MLGNPRLLRPGSGRGASGFSLLELICCIIIVGILAAMAGPRLVDNGPFQQRGYVDQVASALRYAQKVAVASGCAVQFSVTGAGAYQALQRAPAGTSCAPAGAFTRPVSWHDGTALTGTPPANVALAPATTLTFLPQGGLAGGSSSITLSSGSFTLTIDAWSGFVTAP